MIKDSLCCKVYLSRIEKTNEIFQIEIRCSNELHYIFMASLLNVLKISHTIHFPTFSYFLNPLVSILKQLDVWNTQKNS